MKIDRDSNHDAVTEALTDWLFYAAHNETDDTQCSHYGIPTLRWDGDAKEIVLRIADRRFSIQLVEHV